MTWKPTEGETRAAELIDEFDRILCVNEVHLDRVYLNYFSTLIAASIDGAVNNKIEDIAGIEELRAKGVWKVVEPETAESIVVDGVEVPTTVERTLRAVRKSAKRKKAAKRPVLESNA